MGKKYDTVIVGSGLGGLMCGAILSKYGRKVCILEKHFQYGGNLQTFKRKGHDFNTGMHYVGAMDKGQILYKVFDYIGVLDKVKFEALDTDAYEKIQIEDRIYSYAKGKKNFVKTLAQQFPDEEDAIKQYVDKLETTWNSVDLVNLRKLSKDAPFDMEKFASSAYEFIESLTDNQELKTVLAATNGLYAGHPDKTPLYTHAMINYFYMQSAYRISGSSHSLSDALKEIVEEQGGKVLLKQEVKKVNTNQQQKAVSVTTHTGEIFEADSFIFSIHPKEVVKMVDEGVFRKAFVRRMRKLENSVGSFCLYILPQKGTIKHFNHNFYFQRQQDAWTIRDYEKHAWPQGFMLYSSPSAENPDYSESITAITFMKYSEVEKWADTSIEKRGKDYKQFKEEKAKALFQEIEKVVPNIEAQTEYYYTSTPLTYRDYTGIPEGSMYGVAKDYNKPMESFLSSTTRIPNLFLTGQNIGLHGILGVIMSSVITCSNFIEMNTIIEDIKLHAEND